MKKRKMIWQIYPAFLIILLLSLIAITWEAHNSFKSFYLSQTAKDLESRAHILNQQILPYLLSESPEKVDLICKEIGSASGTRITVVLPNGKVVGDSEENPALMDIHSTRIEIIEANKGKVGKSIRYSRTLERNMMYVAIPLTREDKIIGVLRVAIPVEAINSAIRLVWFKLAMGGVIIALVLGGISLVVARRLSRPIGEMKDVALRFAGGELSQKARVYETEEMAGLSDAMNRMAKELSNRINTIVSQRNELETVLSSMMEGVIAVDLEEKIIKVNPSAAAMLDMNPEACRGKSIQEAIRNISFQKLVSKAIAEHRVVETDISFYNGEERMLKAHGSPIMNADDEFMGALMVMEDVTKLRRLENIRRDFVANVSHEIKTPLTAIKGFVETLFHDMTDENNESKRFLTIILKHVDRLNAIVDDLLSLSAIEGEKEAKKIERKRTAVRDVVETAVQVCRPKASEKNIEISTRVDPSVMAEMDVTLFEQAIVNILDNAVKYSDSGSIVEIEAEETAGEIEIRIIDHGIGISGEHLPRLFERFYRVDKARSRKMGGTGLGLSIVKHIVQAHGGDISAESTLGKGSTFTVHLPKHS
jgi:two-component system, OmpR family, phosphate regulon sensor histidine kinase PhoR